MSSFDLSLLDDLLVPADLFFIRNHFPVPNVSLAGWKLSVTGAVAVPVEIPVQELSAGDGTTLGLTLECAENPVGGGLVSHAEWTGLKMSAILERAKPSPQAKFVRLSGADGFSRTIPLPRAMQEDALVAFRMNGERLSPGHGFPLRAIIAGWYGMNSVKWLRSAEVLTDNNEPPRTEYRRQTRSLLAGVRPGDPVTSVKIKSVFARPVDGAVLQRRNFTLRGAAWAGENRVKLVEVSADGGKTWQPAQLSAEPSRYAWVFWSLKWSIPGPGRYDLVVRAEDDRGEKQPAERAADRVDPYELNAWQRISVTVV